MNKLYSSNLKVHVSTYKKYSLNCFWVWRRRFLKVTPIFLFGALPLGATVSTQTTLGPYPPRMIPTQFGWNLSTGSGEEDGNVKSLYTTHDGLKMMTIAHRAFGLGELKINTSIIIKTELLQRKRTKKSNQRNSMQIPVLFIHPLLVYLVNQI